LSQGELAINVTDKKLYSKDSGGNVILIASNGGDVTGPATSTNLAIPTFSGTGGKTLLNNSGVTISSGVITGTGFTGALNGTLGATTPSTVVATTINGTDLTTTGNTILGNASTDTLNVGNGGLVKDTSGNVGIGTASPTSKLQVGDGSSSTGVKVKGTAAFITLDGSSYGQVSATTTLYLDAGTSSPIVFRPNDSTEAMRLDSSGNLGLGVTPSAWSSFKVLEIPNGGSIGTYSNSPVVYINSNTYFNGSSWIYTTTAPSSRYQVNGNTGSHDWLIAPSGTAGNAITFTQAMTLDASGNLGIGTSSPQAKLQVLTTLKVSSADQSSGNVILGDGSSTAFNVGIGRWNGSTNSAGAGGVGYFSQGGTNSGGHYFYTGDAAAGSQTERARIPHTGGFQSVNCVSVGNATPSTSGAGITFPATQSASTDANTLDDYEEGTWSATLTPTISGSITVGSNTGWYVKVGNLVTVGVNIFMSSVSSPVGQVQINGLPFTSVSGNSKRPAVAAGGLVLTSYLGAVSGQIAANSSTAILVVNDQGNWANTIGVSSQIQFMASYVVA
jgi:hypothetical protein